MLPQPPERLGLLRIPAPSATSLHIRYSPTTDRDIFDPAAWPNQPFTPSATFPGWWEFDLDTLALPDAVYEYEFILDGGDIVPDPYADELTRFGYYRGLFHIQGGVRTKLPFRWNAAIEAGAHLPQNNQIVIYEMPLKWMEKASDNSLVDLGTFDKVIYEHLDDLKSLNINCIELLPIMDTTQTLNWGYGTRFYFAPDLDMGTPVDARFFIKSCHARGIRVILDVVMAFFSPSCPLGALAPEWFQAPAGENGRNAWGQNLFLYDRPAYGDYFAAREFLCQMGEFWVTEYHIDGFRIDDFPDIANWDFVREFRDRATAASNDAFPGKPFLVVAENTSRQFETTDPDPAVPGHPTVVDAIWNFGFQQELRMFATSGISTVPGQASRTERVKHFLSKDGIWSDSSKGFDRGYVDLACAVNYVTSHDVQGAPRMANVILGPMLQQSGLGDGSIWNVRAFVDETQGDAGSGLLRIALARIYGVFALILTSLGMPMFLAGEEFGDVHDEDYNQVDSKQQNPVQWQRATLPENAALRARVAELIGIRTSQPALQRNEIEFFYFHPTFDQNDGALVFGFARTAGQSTGSAGQVILLANMGPDGFSSFEFPDWPWGGQPLREIAPANDVPAYNAATDVLSLALGAYQVRVFTV